MSKRQAEETLEDISPVDSPAPKKLRVANERDDDKQPEHVYRSSQTFPSSNGYPAQDDKTSQDHTVTNSNEKDERAEGYVSPVPLTDVQEEESAYLVTSRQSAPLDGYKDLYLDTIDRSVLDFDFEKLCSVTLSNINVYACLVCGKYYQGRGPKSHAYFHALDAGHHVFVNMQTKRVYVLPEGYEVKSKSLEDIKFVVDPKLSMDEVAKLDKEPHEALDLSGKRYRPGIENNPP